MPRAPLQSLECLGPRPPEVGLHRWTHFAFCVSSSLGGANARYIVVSYLAQSPLGGPLGSDELHDLRDQVRRHDHHRLPVRLERRFVLGDLLVFRLAVVMLRQLANARLIPTGRITLL